MQDLARDVTRTDTVAEGLTAEQVVRAALPLTKQKESFGYNDLAFHLLDSVGYRSFCLIGIPDKGFHFQNYWR